MQHILVHASLDLIALLFFGQQVGAKVILGDRNLQITKQRRSKAMKSEAIPILKKTIGEVETFTPQQSRTSDVGLAY